MVIRLRWQLTFISFFLSGCIGASFSGNTRYENCPYPDIRTVPPLPKKNPQENIITELQIEELEMCRDVLEKRRQKVFEK